MERRLSSILQDKIRAFNIQEPYVWRLRLSEADFNELEASLRHCASSKGLSSLTSDQVAAKETLIYIAEWYKRKYQSGNKIEWIEGLDMESLWKAVGINQKSYLYRDEAGNKRWLYSTYVLGGLAIEHELNRNDGRRFMKALCKLYHGEEYTLENLDETSRAVAFRESIKRRHSLYEYMQAILNGGDDMPFCEEELKNEDSNINRFIEAIKTANDEIWKEKFRLEWQVNFSEDYQYMTRQLNIWLKPEEVGGGLHQYLRYDRARLWGLAHPESQQHLYIFIRFKQNEEIVAPDSMKKPIAYFLNHGIGDFIAIGIEKRIQVRHLPSCKFNQIEIIVKDDEGNEYIAQNQICSEYIQLWRLDAYDSIWSSTQNAQKETALLFSKKCSICKDNGEIQVIQKAFKDSQFGISETWNWTYIYDSVSIINEKEAKLTFYNRIGYDQITAKLYRDTISYVNGGMIRHYYVDDPDISEETDIEQLPVIFGKEDIIARHFMTKDDILNAQPEADTEIESIMFGQQVWNKEHKPGFGVVKLKITVKGKTFPFTVIYLPKWTDDIPIKRDFEECQIIYKDLAGKTCSFKDEIPLNNKCLSPTLTLQWGSKDDYVEIDVYRPTLIKEILLDGKIINYIDDEEIVTLPYILKDRVCIHDFSRKGYQAYECKNLGNIYTNDFINIDKNSNAGRAAIDSWDNDTRYKGILLDSLAPSCLVVCFGNAKKEAAWQNQTAYVWNYDKNEDPKVANPSDIPEFGIIFQGMSKNKDLTCNYPIQQDDDPWAWDDIEASEMKCFEVANENGIYFFIMRPLLNISKKEDFLHSIYEPLLEERNGELTVTDKKGLIRLSQEFDFNWIDFGINLA